MEIEDDNQKQYIKLKKDFYQNLLSYIEGDDQNQDDESFFKQIDFIKSRKSESEMEEILYLIQFISNNHKRNSNFNKKIEKILEALYDTINQTFSSFKVFEIFKNNKLVLLFLLKMKLISLDDDDIFNFIINDEIYSQYFYPEIKSRLNENELKEIESKLQSYGQNIFDNFEEYRQKGENESYICSLIRQDSVEEFIAYINKSIISLSMKIKPSIFETNPFLIDKNPSLIKYSAFYGSIKIFNYLKFNNVNFKSSLWLYGIHSQNAELIHKLEHNEINIKNRSYEEFFEEALKCHHNNIAEYIQDNLIKIKLDKEKEFEDNTIKFCLMHHNYGYLPDKIDLNDNFFSLNQYHYPEFVNICVMYKNDYLNSIIIK